MEVPCCKTTTKTCAAHGTHYSEKPPVEIVEIMPFFYMCTVKKWKDGLSEIFPKPGVVEILMEEHTPSLLCL